MENLWIYKIPADWYLSGSRGFCWFHVQIVQEVTTKYWAYIILKIGYLGKCVSPEKIVVFCALLFIWGYKEETQNNIFFQ